MNGWMADWRTGRTGECPAATLVGPIREEPFWAQIAGYWAAVAGFHWLAGSSKRMRSSPLTFFFSQIMVPSFFFSLLFPFTPCAGLWGNALRTHDFVPMDVT